MEDLARMWALSPSKSKELENRVEALLGTTGEQIDAGRRTVCMELRTLQALLDLLEAGGRK